MTLDEAREWVYVYVCTKSRDGGLRGLNERRERG